MAQSIRACPMSFQNTINRLNRSRDGRDISVERTPSSEMQALRYAGELVAALAATGQRPCWETASRDVCDDEECPGKPRPFASVLRNPPSSRNRKRRKLETRDASFTHETRIDFERNVQVTEKGLLVKLGQACATMKGARCNVQQFR